ncbi:MAG: FAD-binding protein [Planctomycetia bacterium]
MSSEQPEDVSRRTVLKQAALGGAGLIAASVLTGGGEQAHAAIEQVAAKDTWLAERASCVSGNRLVTSLVGEPVRTEARAIYRPGSAREIADLIRSLPTGTPVATVCGGHESSNAAAVAGDAAVILDMARLKSIDFHEEGGRRLVTVGGGVVFRELVEAVRERKAALPVGTGPGVGVVGYLVNGGLSGYFSRRLGLLGQRVTRLTVVTAAGEIRVVTPDDDLFTALLGAGSGLAVVADVTLELAPEGVVKGAEQRGIAFQTRDQAVAFAREALRMQRDQVLADDSVSMELVVAGTKVLVATVVFYDSFQGNMAEFVSPLEQLAARLGLPVVAVAHFGSWFETAAALWPVIDGMKGSPLAMLQHCLGTEAAPADAILDAVCDTVVAHAPLDEAPLSIVEIRTLGGAALTMRPLPTGNCRHRFFVDLVTMYDAKDKSAAERRAIADATRSVVVAARRVEGLAVDFSGTHSQPDDPGMDVSPALIFGTEAMAELVRGQKKRVDPDNRFRYHPFAKFL